MGSWHSFFDRAIFFSFCLWMSIVEPTQEGTTQPRETRRQPGILLTVCSGHLLFFSFDTLSHLQTKSWLYFVSCGGKHQQCPKRNLLRHGMLQHASSSSWWGCRSHVQNCMGTQKPCTPPPQSTNNHLQTLNTKSKQLAALLVGPQSRNPSPFLTLVHIHKLPNGAMCHYSYADDHVSKCGHIHKLPNGAMFNGQVAVSASGSGRACSLQLSSPFVHAGRMWKGHSVRWVTFSHMIVCI